MNDLQTKLKEFVASKKRISDAILSKFEYVEELKQCILSLINCLRWRFV